MRSPGRIFATSSISAIEAAHLLAPLAIAEGLGLDYAKVPLLAPVTLNQNGNSILLGNETFAALSAFAEGDLDDPAQSGKALKKLIAARAGRGEDRLNFGMTFPFSSHNYVLRFWMAASGVDPDEDVRLVVLPPPYMVDSLKSGHVNGFCVGAPWGSVAVEAGIGHIIHLGTDIVATCPEKVLGVRAAWAEENTAVLNALTRAVIRATSWCANPEHRGELAHLLAEPGRLNVDPDLIVRALNGRLKVDPAGRTRENPRYLVMDSALARPECRQALWLYAQMARWGQAPFDEGRVAAVNACFSPATYDAALASMTQRPVLDDGIGAFAGPSFDPSDIAAYLAAVK